MIATGSGTSAPDRRRRGSIDRLGSPSEPSAGGTGAPAIVIGLDCTTGLQSARILARRGVPVIGLAGDLRHPCCRTNVCERILPADTAGAGLVESLEMLGPELGEKAVLFPCTDTSVLLISRHRERLEPWFRMVLPARDVVERLVDKERFYRYAQREALPVPRTFFLRTRTDAEEAARALRFPCVIKPSLKTPEWKTRSGAKAHRASSAGQLLAIYERFAPCAEVLIAQEWVEGSDSEYYTCNCYLDAASEPLVTFITRKLRQWPPKGGEGCLSEEARNDVVLEQTIRLFRDARHRGLGYLEMKRDARTGEYFIIEPNIGRPTGRSANAEAAGVELLYTAYCDAIGRPLPAGRHQEHRGVKWIHVRRDVQAALYYWWKGELTLREWHRSWRGPKVDALLSWTDPAPFWADLGRVVREAALGRKRVPGLGRTERVRGDPATNGGRTGLERRRRPPFAAGEHRHGARDVDFDLHDLVRIRLIDAAPGDVAAVSAQLGRTASAPGRDPDMIVRFVDRLALPSPLRLLGTGEAGYTDDAFVVLRGKHKTPARVRIPFDAIGDRLEITCERGVPAVPLLTAIINLTALARGALPMHASAFRYRGTGVLVTGWSKGGKTETLIGFMANGAEYLGDEWVYLSGDGRRMYGLPEPIRIWDWHLEGLPGYRRRLAYGSRARLWTLGHLTRRLERLAAADRGQSSHWRRDLKRLIHLLQSQRYVDLAPEELFGRATSAPDAPVDRVIFVASHDSPEIRVGRLDPAELADRMAFSLQEERSAFLAYYRRFRFALPHKCSPIVESADRIEHERLHRVLAGKECYAVHHPYPISSTALFEAVRPLMEQSGVPR